MQIHPSALKHNYTELDIRFALEHVHIERRVVDEDLYRTWIFGFAPDVTLLELMALHLSSGDLVIHCMKARPRELARALGLRGARRSW